MGFEPADGFEAFGIDLNLLMILVQIYKGVRNLKMPKTWRTCSVDRRCRSIGPNLVKCNLMLNLVCT